MIDLISIPLRLVIGLLSILVTWLVLDNIHDRNTEIIVSCLGLIYCFVFVISRRWQYYGLNTISLFGITASWLDKAPYDQATRQQLNLPLKRSYVVVSIALAAIVELLCAYRLLTSLLGHGWERLSAPLRAALDWPQIHAALNWL